MTLILASKKSQIAKCIKLAKNANIEVMHIETSRTVTF